MGCAKLCEPGGIIKNMEEVTTRISEALAKEEARAERFANRARLILLLILTSIALLNARAVSVEANLMNIGALVIGYTYGFIVFIRIHRLGFFPMMKYITSCFDIILLFLLLFMYTRIEIPSVALKNYAFLIVFPLIALTAFRYDPMLTLISGGLAVTLYLVLVMFLYLSGSIAITNLGYEHELFSQDVTYVGQVTKILVLVGYITLLSYLAQYSRKLFVKLVRHESNIRSQKELMEWELKIASDVQTQLQPHLFPEVTGLDIYGTVEQGRFVGGDYCDFLKLADDVLLIVMADVSGKGVPAALIMSEVRASIQLLASMNMDLENLTRRLNTLLYQSTRKKDFVTFFAATINTTRRVMTYVNAGHPPSLIYSNGDIRSLAQRTIPLGLFTSLPELAIQTEEFPSGSIFVSYTDGVLERMNLQGEEYGEQRLREYVRAEFHLNAQPFVRQLLEKVKGFGQGKDLDDDVGIAVVKYFTSLSL